MLWATICYYVRFYTWDFRENTTTSRMNSNGTYSRKRDQILSYSLALCVPYNFLLEIMIFSKKRNFNQKTYTLCALSTASFSWANCDRSICAAYFRAAATMSYSKGSTNIVTFFKISYFLERIRIEHVEMKNSLDSKLQINSTCSIRIRSRK